MHKSILLATFAGLLLAASLLGRVSGQTLAGVDTANQIGAPAAPAETPTAEPTPPPQYLPLVGTNQRHLWVEFQRAYVTTAGSRENTAFLPGESLMYVIEGMNITDIPATANVTWSISGPCGEQIYSGSGISLSRGTWRYSFPQTAPNCLGIYLMAVQFQYLDKLQEIAALFVVVNPSAVLTTDQPAFDRCSLPSVGQMQAWWDESPYSEFNLYLGGISFFCRDDVPDAPWVYNVAQQGWTFILTWVGPQAPCTTYRYRMSANAEIAYGQGRAEADAAFTAAENIGFLEDKVIYYDMEYFATSSTSCKITVARFLQGWTDRLHELARQTGKNVRAGGYGGACGSHMREWAEYMSPDLDDVWIAYWNYSFYDSTASVYDMPACFPNAMWRDRQRIRQYAGDHGERWGGVSMTIDSNALDGNVSRLPPGAQNIAGETDLAAPVDVRDFALLDSGQGWALSSNVLLWTEDNGTSWRDITPGSSGTYLLDAAFSDPRTGYAVVIAPAGDLTVWRTRNAGLAWEAVALPGVGPDGAGNAHLEFSGDFGCLSLSLPSGSSFSRGVLYLTSDGGATWTQQSLPAGGKTHFTDPANGWLVGGPTHDQIFRTSDGGKTWHETNQLPDFTDQTDLPGLSALNETGVTVPGLPAAAVSAVDFAGPQAGWALVQAGGCVGEKVPGVSAPVCSSYRQLYTTADGGRNWLLLNPQADR